MKTDFFKFFKIKRRKISGNTLKNPKIKPPFQREISLVNLANKNFTLVINRKNRLKNIHIKLKDASEIQITCSISTPFPSIKFALNKHEQWILKRSKKLEDQKSKILQYIEGELHPFNGENFPLNIIFYEKKRPQLHFKEKIFQAFLSNDLSHQQVKKELAKLFTKFYKQQTEELCKHQLKELQKIHYFSFKNIKIKKMKSRWGSCSQEKNLNFNQDLAKLPAHMRNYIIAHEYAHLKELNHSKNFWEIVKFFEPKYKTFRSELRAIEQNLKFENI